MADIEKTIIMIKPDAVRDRKTGLIIDRIERCGLTIEKMEKCELDEDLVKVHYAHLGDFANDVNANIIHGSDSLENAAIEIERFFG